MSLFAGIGNQSVAFFDFIFWVLFIRLIAQCFGIPRLCTCIIFGSHGLVCLGNGCIVSGLGGKQIGNGFEFIFWQLLGRFQIGCFLITGFGGIVCFCSHGRITGSQGCFVIGIDLGLLACIGDLVIAFLYFVFGVLFIRFITQCFGIPRLCTSIIFCSHGLVCFGNGPIVFRLSGEQIGNGLEFIFGQLFAWFEIGGFLITGFGGIVCFCRHGRVARCHCRFIIGIDLGLFSGIGNLGITFFDFSLWVWFVRFVSKRFGISRFRSHIIFGSHGIIGFDNSCIVFYFIGNSHLLLKNKACKIFEFVFGQLFRWLQISGFLIAGLCCIVRFGGHSSIAGSKGSLVISFRAFVF